MVVKKKAAPRRKKKKNANKLLQALKWCQEHPAATNVFRFACVAALLYVASGNKWDHIHNVLLGWHFHLLWGSAAGE